ncbi:hypothetical protein BD309DRAFT_944919 [Dichomitus squalens]|nr:hypothetical protein BD309DRAFT_944919 [Dichomitus squalens]
MYQGVALLFSGLGEVRSWLLVSQRSINVVHVERSSPLTVLIPYCYLERSTAAWSPCSMTCDNSLQPRCASTLVDLVRIGAVYISKSIHICLEFAGMF